MQNETKYVLTLTSEQASALSVACETLARIRIGQLDQLEDAIFWSHPLPDKDAVDEHFKHLDEFRNKLNELETIAFPKGWCSLGSDKFAETAWNIYQVIRYKQAWHDHPEGGTTVNFHRPLDISGVGLPSCEVIEEEKPK